MKFKITIALIRSLAVRALLQQLKSLRFEDALVNLVIWEMYTTYEVLRDIAIQKREIDYIKIKSSRLS